MPDVGSIVTDAEVTGMIPLVRSMDARATFLVKAVEAEVSRYCGRTFPETTYEDFPLDGGRGEEAYGETVTRRRTLLRLPAYPVTAWTALKEVTARSATTGLPSATVTVPRDAYYVDAARGWVRLLQAFAGSALAGSLRTSWPAGEASLAATFKAGFTSMPFDLKLAVLQEITRQWDLFDKHGFVKTSDAHDTGTTTFGRVVLSDETKFALRHYRRWGMG